MKIAFLGLGIMGRPMALNLLKGGHDVTVWARRAESMLPLQEAGADTATSPAEAVRGAELVISMVADAPDVLDVLRQAAPGASAGLVAVDMSTIAPAAARNIHDELAALGIDFMDAPVSGGEVGAIAGTLSIMAGGSEAAFSRARPAFECMGKNIRPRRRQRRRPGNQGSQPDRHRHGRAGGGRGLCFCRQKRGSTAAKCARRYWVALPIRKFSKTTASACSTVISSRVSRAGCTRKI